MTISEKKLWAAIRKDQLGVRVLRQKIIGNFIADFYIRKHKLIIEVDGGSHNGKEKFDLFREAALREKGYKFVRFWDWEVSDDLNSVLERIKAELKQSIPSLPLKKEGVNDAD